MTHINNTAPGRSVCFLLTGFFFPDPQSVTAMGSPGNVSLIKNFTGRQGMDSAASTAMTTPVAFTASGARKDSTDREKETAVYPATVTPKVAGEKGQRGGGEGEEGKEGKRESGLEGEANRPGERCSTSRTTGNLTRHYFLLLFFVNFSLKRNTFF